MHRFWKTIIHPAFDTFHPRSIVEIGVDDGLQTRHLLEYCNEHDCILHAIDPLPGASFEEWVNRDGGAVHFYKDLSLNVLGRIDEMDAVLIDGDHNWYTVYHELLLLEKYAATAGHFPVVFFHDTGWPYSRRDLYYAPEQIPELYRKAHAKKGIVQGSGALQESGGLNAHVWNAVEENVLQNGVLTAIEDFLGQTSLRLRFITVPGLHGLGIIAPEDLLTSCPELSAFLHTLQASPALKDHMEAMEEERIGYVIDLHTQRREAKEALFLLQTETTALLHTREQESAAALHVAKQEAAISLRLAEERMAGVITAIREESDKTVAAAREDYALILKEMQEESAATREQLHNEYREQLASVDRKYAELMQREEGERMRLAEAFNTVRGNYLQLEQEVQEARRCEAEWKDTAIAFSAEGEKRKTLIDRKEWLHSKTASVKKISSESGYLIMSDLRRLWIAAGSPFPAFTRTVRSKVFGYFWPVRPDAGIAPKSDSSGINVTLCVALSGRSWAWPITARFLETQTYPHQQIHLCVQDTSQDPAFHATVEEWLQTCDYASYTLIASAVGQKGLADMDRDLRSREVAKVCSQIYKTFAGLCQTPVVCILEDDIEPPIDAYVRLMKHLGGAIQSVSAWYIHRHSDAVVAWDWSPTGEILGIEPRMGISPVGGNGFGCVVLAGDAFRNGNFDTEARYKHFDFSFYDTLVQQKRKTALIDWSLRCRHYASKDVWK